MPSTKRKEVERVRSEYSQLAIRRILVPVYLPRR